MLQMRVTNFLSVFVVLFFRTILTVCAGGVFTDGHFQYMVEDYVYDGDSAVYIVGMEDSLRTATILVLPGSIVHNGYEYRVTGVGENAFARNGCVEQVVIGEGIEAIYDYAFFDSPLLQSIVISSTVDYISSSAFGFCPNLRSISVDRRNEIFSSPEGCNVIVDEKNKELVLGCRTSVIPKGIECIGESAFYGCLGMEELSVPEGVVEIGSGAFSGCAGLKSVVLPHTLERIGEFAFWGCAQMKSLHIPSKVSSIQAPLFGKCWMLDTIEVDTLNPVYDSRYGCNAIVETASDKIISGCGNSRIVEGVKEIGEAAFVHSSLRAVEIPKTVTLIGERAFACCIFCISMEVDVQNPVYDSRQGCNAVIETATGKVVAGCAKTNFVNGVGEIGAYAFTGMYMPPYFIIPEGIRKIGNSAFSFCEGLDLVFIPNSVEEIGTSVFHSSSLRQVYWNASMDEIPESSFSGCENLYAIAFSEEIKSVGAYAFRNCSGLFYMQLPDVEYIGYNAFGGSPCEEVIKKNYSSALSSDYGQPQRSIRKRQPM